MSGVEALAEALKLVEENAAPTFLEAAELALVFVLALGAPFTTEDLKWHVGVPCREPRVWGAIVKNAARDGRIRKTGRWVESTDPQAHCRPMAEWEPA
jgi:hypothetical protein